MNPPTVAPSRAKTPNGRSKKARKPRPPGLRSSARLTSSVYIKAGASTRTYAASPASSPERRGGPRRIESAQSALPSASPTPAPKNALKPSSSVAEVGPTCAVPCAWRRNAAARPTPSPPATPVAMATRERSRRSLMTLVCRSGDIPEHWRRRPRPCRRPLRAMRSRSGEACREAHRSAALRSRDTSAGVPRGGIQLSPRLAGRRWCLG
jgi:hypothetical protein